MLCNRAKMETFLKEHTAKLDLPPVKGDETIFEFVVSDTGKVHALQMNQSKVNTSV